MTKKIKTPVVEDKRNAFQLREWKLATLPLSTVASSGELQSRVPPKGEKTLAAWESERASFIAGIAEAYAAGIPVDAIHVVRITLADGTFKFEVVDGHHRHAAATLAKMKGIPCFVTDGTMEEALILASAANATNSRTRTNDDKNNAVILAHKVPKDNPFWALTVRAAGFMLGVSHEMVRLYRVSQTGKGKRGSNGKGNGGASKAKPVRAVALPEIGEHEENPGAVSIDEMLEFIYNTLGENGKASYTSAVPGVPGRYGKIRVELFEGEEPGDDDSEGNGDDKGEE